MFRAIVDFQHCKKATPIHFLIAHQHISHSFQWSGFTEIIQTSRGEAFNCILLLDTWVIRLGHFQFMQALSSKSQLCQLLRIQNESLYRNYRSLQKPSVGSKTHTQRTTLLVQLPAQKGFSGGSDGKRICLPSRRPGFDRWVGKISQRREWLPTPVFLPRESHAQRSLAGYSPSMRLQRAGQDSVTNTN